MSGPWTDFAPAATAGPWADFAPAAADYGIDFTQPQGHVRTAIAKLPKEQRDGALKAWADTTVAKERSAGGTGISDFVRNFARGTPVGSWLDEANAATMGALNTVSGGRVGAPYDETLAYQHALDRAADAGGTKLGELPLVGDVTSSGLQKLAGGIASAPLSPVMRMFQGGTALPAMGNAALTGGLYGAAYGAGEGQGIPERAQNAALGAGVGGLLGGAAVPVARGVGNAYQAFASRMAPLPQELAGQNRGAVSRLAQSMGEDGLTPQTYAARASELGPEGMLGDMGQNLRMDAARIARNPGEGRSVVVGALNARKAGAPGRIAADTDAALGPAPNIPETIEATAQHYRQAAEPLRQQFQNRPVPFTNELDNIFQGLGDDLPRVLANARRYANIDPASGRRQFFARQNADGEWIVERVPNASEWDYIKRTLDGMARSQDRNDQRIFGHWARQVRNAVDEAISPGNPAQSPWARARALEAENYQVAEAVDAGRNAFARNISPEQMGAEMFGVGTPPRGGMTPPALHGYRVGARDQVRQIMGNASTSWGANGDTAARARLGSDNAREKLGLIAGQPAADRLVRRLDAETAFERTRDLADRNSVTSTMQAAAAKWPAADGANNTATELGRKSLTGMVAEGAYRIANTLSGGAINEHRIRVATNAARMLVAQGQSRDNIARGLLAYSQRQGITANHRAALEMIAENLIAGARGATIGRSTGEGGGMAQ